MADLTEAFPALADAHVEIGDLTGTARGSFAEAIGHDVLHLDLDGETADEVRQSILADLAAQGIEGDIHVHVDDGEGLRTITVGVEDEAAGEQTEDTFIIEQKTD